MTLVSIGDAELYTEIHGEGEDLLLVAGLGGMATFWHKQVEFLAQHYRVILHDHRGVGRSTDAPVVSAASEMAEDLVRLMDAMNIESAHIVGHSTGGAIGQNIAVHHPERVRSLVLSASWAGPTPLFVDTFRVRRDILINCGVKHYMMVGSLLASPAWTLTDSYQGMEHYLADRIKHFAGLETELARLNAVMTHDLRHRVKEITAPTGVISAKDDSLTPPSMSDELADRIPGAVRVRLEEGGHFCPVTTSEHYNQQLLDLLKTINR
ncbi:MAG: alpha/beta fold hydrolase [Woeseiaceae bacterium]